MRKLFDELFEHETKNYKTIWYGYLEELIEEAFVAELVELIKNDLATKQSRATLTHWVIHFEKKSKTRLRMK